MIVNTFLILIISLDEAVENGLTDDILYSDVKISTHQHPKKQNNGNLRSFVGYLFVFIQLQFYKMLLSSDYIHRDFMSHEKISMRIL